MSGYKITLYRDFSADDNATIKEYVRQYKKLFHLKNLVAEPADDHYNHVTQLEMDVDREINALIESLAHIVKRNISDEQCLVAVLEAHDNV